MRNSVSHTVPPYPHGHTHDCGYTHQPQAGCSLNYPAVISLLLMVPSLMVSMISSYWLCNFSLAMLGWEGKWIWCNKLEQFHFHIYYVFHSFSFFFSTYYVSYIYFFTVTPGCWPVLYWPLCSTSGAIWAGKTLATVFNSSHWKNYIHPWGPFSRPCEFVLHDGSIQSPSLRSLVYRGNSKCGNVSSRH